jgi:hypothetical protein
VVAVLVPLALLVEGGGRIVPRRHNSRPASQESETSFECKKAKDEKKIC